MSPDAYLFEIRLFGHIESSEAYEPWSFEILFLLNSASDFLVDFIYFNPSWRHSSRRVNVMPLLNFSCI